MKVEWALYKVKRVSYEKGYFYIYWGAVVLIEKLHPRVMFPSFSVG